MSGHSKWHKLKNKKGKTDAARANVFTKLCRAVTVAAMQSGGDPEMNFTLRLAIDKARAANVPKENIERAIKRGSGEGSDEATLESLVYEGFGPGGSAFLVETLTDNRNRTVADVKHIFSAHGGALGAQGSVAWQFVRRAVVVFQGEACAAITDDTELAAIDAGVVDVVRHDEHVEFFGAPDHLEAILAFCTSRGLVVSESHVAFVPTTPVSLTDEDIEKSMRLYDALDEHDDVRAVYTSIA